MEYKELLLNRLFKLSFYQKHMGFVYLFSELVSMDMEHLKLLENAISFAEKQNPLVYIREKGEKVDGVKDKHR